MRGRKPKPTGLKELDGNPGKRRLNSDEPKVESGLPLCPAYLDALAAKKWAELAANVSWFGTVDADIVAAYCSEWSRWARGLVAIKELITKDNPLPEVLKNGQQNMTLHTVRAAEERLMKLSALLGLNPADRSRLKVPGHDSDDDALAKFMGQATAVN